MKKSGIILSDLHSGSEVGLTPPDFQYKDNASCNQAKYAQLQAQAWGWYTKTLKTLGKVDYLFCVGDLIDGQNMKNNGVGQITTSIEKQCHMAIDCLKEIKAKKIEIIQGTGYHVTSNGSEAERYIAEAVGANFGIHTFVDINGFVFNLKHKTSRSIIPHGRMTGPARAKLWEVIWKQTKGFPTSDLLVRGHVHYYQYYCSGMGAIMTLPCLKTLGDRYGASNYDDTIDYGFIYFEIDDDGTFNHKWLTPNFKREIPRVRKI